MGWLGTLGRGLRRAIAWGGVVLLWGSLMAIAGCAKEPMSLTAVATAKPSPGKLVGAIAEVAPPTIVQRLNRELDRYQPQVDIIAPRPDELVTQTEVMVQLRVRDLPLFKDEGLAAGPHVTVMLDDRPVAEIFDENAPIALQDLTPGTHTLRAFAERPWHESFKNDGAFAQTTFHVFTKTRDRVPDPSQPLLTYNQPKGVVGTEPVLLDFYLTNAPLHLLARERDDDEIRDWKIRATINGDSFVLDDWQSIYLKGFRRGTNWVKLELIDDRGELIANAFNESVALVEYDPNQSSTIDRLMKGELPEAEAQAIIDPNYESLAPEPEPEPEPEPVQVIAPEPTPALEPMPEPVNEPVNEPEPAALPEPEPIAAPEEPTAEIGDSPTSEPSWEPAAANSAPIESPAAVEALDEPVTEPARASTEAVPSASSSESLDQAQDQPLTTDEPEPIASPEPAPAPEIAPPAAIESEPVTEPAPAASPEPAPVAEPEPELIERPIAPEPIAPQTAPVVEPAIAPAPQPAATDKPAKPLSGARKQFLKWLKQAQQNLPDDLNLPFDIKQVPLPSGD
jgi:hypothetical protein